MNCLYSQAPKKDWDKRYGGGIGPRSVSPQEIPYKIISDRDNFYISGFTRSKLSNDVTEELRDTFSHSDVGDYWIIKISNSGNLIWDKRFGSFNRDIAYCMLKINEDIYIGGFSSSDIGFEKSQSKISNLNDNTNGDYWIVKMDTNRNKIWDKTYGGSDFEIARSLVKINDNELMIVGFSASNTGFDKSQNSRGQTDIWVIKFDSSGNKIWDKTYGGNLIDQCMPNTSIITNDGIIIGAYSASNVSDEKSENSKGATDFWIIKIGFDGNIIWDKTYGGDSDEIVYAIKQANDGGYLVGGVSQSNISGDKSTPNKGGNDYWLIKLDTNGNKLWDKTYGGTGSDYIFDIELDIDGSILLLGRSSSSNNGDKSEPSQGSADIWIIKIDNNGDIIWDKSFGGSGVDSADDLAVIDINTYLICGNSNSPADGDKSEPAYNNSLDFWLLKTKPGDPFALEDLKLQTATYRDKIKLTWKDSRPQGSEVRYAILHSSGKEIKSSNWDTLGYTGQKEYNHLHPEYGTHRYRICRMEEFGGCSVSNIQSVTYENHLERIIITTNRAQEAINIEYQLPDERGSVSVYNGQGSLIHEQRLSHKGLLHIETINWPSGVYYFQFVGIYGVLESRKVIVEK